MLQSELHYLNNRFHYTVISVMKDVKVPLPESFAIHFSGLGMQNTDYSLKKATAIYLTPLTLIFKKIPNDVVCLLLTSPFYKPDISIISNPLRQVIDLLNAFCPSILFSPVSDWTSLKCFKFSHLWNSSGFAYFTEFKTSRSAYIFNKLFLVLKFVFNLANYYFSRKSFLASAILRSFHLYHPLFILPQ